MSRLRSVIAAPATAFASARGLLGGVTAQELTLGGSVLIGLQFGWGWTGLTLVVLGLGLSLEWTERLRR